MDNKTRFLTIMYNFQKIFIYLFLKRGERREKERDRNINVWLPLTCPLLGTWPTTQACALTGNQTSDPLVHRLTPSPLSHTSQGKTIIYNLFLILKFSYVYMCYLLSFGTLALSFLAYLSKWTFTVVQRRNRKWLCSRIRVSLTSSVLLSLSTFKHNLG